MDSMGRNEDSYSGWAVSVLEVRNTGSANQRRGGCATCPSPPLNPTRGQRAPDSCLRIQPLVKPAVITVFRDSRIDHFVWTRTSEDYSVVKTVGLALPELHGRRSYQIAAPRHVSSTMFSNVDQKHS